MKLWVEKKMKKYAYVEPINVGTGGNVNKTRTLVLANLRIEMLTTKEKRRKLEWLRSRKKKKERVKNEKKRLLYGENIEGYTTRRARRVHWRLPGEGSWIKVEGTTAFLRHLASNICLYGWCVCNTNTCVSSETGNKTGFGLELWMFERVKSK